MSFHKFVSIFALAAAAAFAQTMTTTNTATRTMQFGPIGVASSETAQVNLLNTASASPSGTAASCTGTVAFTNASGAAVGSSTSFTIASNEISSVKVAGTGTDTREELVATITLNFTSGTPCALATSYEIYDTATGVTHAYIAGGQMQGPPVGPFGH